LISYFLGIDVEGSSLVLAFVESLVDVVPVPVLFEQEVENIKNDAIIKFDNSLIFIVAEVKLILCITKIDFNYKIYKLWKSVCFQ